MLVVLAAGVVACFRDERPDLATGAGASTSAMASSSSTSTGSSTTGPVITGATTDATTSTSAGTNTTSATTGTTSPATTGASDSSGMGDPGFDECGRADENFSCWLCCQSKVRGSQMYIDALAPCLCQEDGPCQFSCILDLCQGEQISEMCFDCIAAQSRNPCIDTVVAACYADEACKPFVECVFQQECPAKP